MRPGAPEASLVFRAWSSNAGSQPISKSAPPSIRASARLSFRIKLGLASTKCGSSVGLARVVTETSFPPTAVAMAPKSGVVATTFSFADADWQSVVRLATTQAHSKATQAFILTYCRLSPWERRRAAGKFRVHDLENSPAGRRRSEVFTFEFLNIFISIKICVRHESRAETRLASRRNARCRKTLRGHNCTGDGS